MDGPVPAASLYRAHSFPGRVSLTRNCLIDIARRAAGGVTQLPCLRFPKAGRCGGGLIGAIDWSDRGVDSAVWPQTMQGAALRTGSRLLSTVSMDFSAGRCRRTVQGMWVADEGASRTAEFQLIVNATQMGITKRKNTAKQQRLAQDETVCRHGSGRALDMRESGLTARKAAKADGRWRGGNERISGRCRRGTARCEWQGDGWRCKKRRPGADAKAERGERKRTRTRRGRRGRGRRRSLPRSIEMVEGSIRAAGDAVTTIHAARDVTNHVIRTWYRDAGGRVGEWAAKWGPAASRKSGHDTRGTVPDTDTQIGGKTARYSSL